MCAGGWLGYCPFFCTRSRFNRLYRDTGQLGACQGGPDTANSAPRHGVQACDTTCDTVGLRAGANNAHASPGHSVSRYKILYRDRGGDTVLQHGSNACDTALGYDPARATWCAARATQPSARGMGSRSRYNFSIVTGG